MYHTFELKKVWHHRIAEELLCVYIMSVQSKVEPLQCPAS